MAAVSLDYDVESKALLVRGADARVTRNPLFAAYFRQIGGTVGREGVLSLPTREDALPARYQAVSRILAGLGVGLEKGGYVSAALDLVQSEERRFAEFSRHAEEIWSNQIDTEAFREFVEVVERNCPGRVFVQTTAVSFPFGLCTECLQLFGSRRWQDLRGLCSLYLPEEPSVREQKAVQRLLIVGPLSSFKAWEDEYRQIFRARPQSKRVSGAMPAPDRADYLRGVWIGSPRRGVDPHILRDSRQFRRGFSDIPHASRAKNHDGFRRGPLHQKH